MGEEEEEDAERGDACPSETSESTRSNSSEDESEDE